MSCSVATLGDSVRLSGEGIMAAIAGAVLGRYCDVGFAAKELELN